MIEKLEDIRIKYMELTQRLADPDEIADQSSWQKMAKEHAAMQEVVEKYEEYLKIKQDYDYAKEMLAVEKDNEMLKMFEQETYDSKAKMEDIEEELKVMLLPKDEDDDKNVIMEIRAGAGGVEGGLFGEDLKRMYELFASKQGWSIEILDINEIDGGGIRECSMLIKGDDAFSKLKFEGGVHRVQRIPDTESQGRVHTSTATVAVLPERENVQIELDEKDLQIDTYRSSGAGGQHVNKTESAIRITHLPTGMVVTCQDERSQGKNKERALGLMKNKLYDLYQGQANSEYAEQRKTQVGMGDRCEKIRTYNYPQNRVTDHRINFTMYSLERFMDGDILEMIEALQVADKQAKLLANTDKLK